ncbi:MAG: gliding motility protein GldL [Bacteroidia bacterium]|nr:gliding motility protein GldL [Bacteroidia bacterium]MDW8333836.1 gliding motility protein GldL [Bacteroidia bacterium]
MAIKQEKESGMEKFFNSRPWKKAQAFIYGLGASVVIIGAMFKILHWKGANEMLIVGLTTEAVIFAISAVEPLPKEHKEYHWELVYPELEPDPEALETGEIEEKPKPQRLDTGKIQGELDRITQTLKPELFESLSGSLTGLKKGVEKISDISSATVATNEFSEKLKGATNQIQRLSVEYTNTAETMNKFNKSMLAVSGTQEQISNDVKNYQAALQKVTGHLSSLSGIYEVELQDVKKHISAINSFYGQITKVTQNLLDTTKDTDALRVEVGNLAQNMHALNTIYGSMLTAMATASAVNRKQ